MIESTVQEQIRKVIKRIDNLHYEIPGNLRNSPDDENRITSLTFTLTEFMTYSSLGKRLQQEVESNTSKNLRPAEESRYLGNLDDLLDSINQTYSEVEKQEWEDKVLHHSQISSYPSYPNLNNSRLNEKAQSLIYELIEQVRLSFYNIWDECEHVAVLASKLFYSQQDYERYPIITLFLPEEPHPIQTPKEKPEIDQDKIQNTVELSRLTYSTVKLRWNGTNDSLYDLFAQLSLLNKDFSTPLVGNTIEEIARFLSEHVEGMPTLETIERRIRAFREPNGERPKRNRIEIDITKGNS